MHKQTKANERRKICGSVATLCNFLCFCNIKLLMAPNVYRINFFLLLLAWWRRLNGKTNWKKQKLIKGFQTHGNLWGSSGGYVMFKFLGNDAFAWSSLDSDRNEQDQGWKVGLPSIPFKYITQFAFQLHITCWWLLKSFPILLVKQKTKLKIMAEKGNISGRSDDCRRFQREKCPNNLFC